MIPSRIIRALVLRCRYWSTRATAVIFSAVPLGSVLGVPAGTFVGELAGWRTSFAALGVLALIALVALRTTVPPLPPVQVTRAAVLGKALRSSPMALVVTCLIVTAHFATYTYITPFLREVVRPEVIGLFLLVYGAAGLVGNAIAGTYAPRRLTTTFMTCASLIATSTLVMPVLGRSTAGARPRGGQVVRVGGDGCWRGLRAAHGWRTAVVQNTGGFGDVASRCGEDRRRPVPWCAGSAPGG